MEEDGVDWMWNNNHHYHGSGGKRRPRRARSPPPAREQRYGGNGCWDCSDDEGDKKEDMEDSDNYQQAGQVRQGGRGEMPMVYYLMKVQDRRGG